MDRPGVSRPDDVPEGVIGASVEDVELQSQWDKPNNRGCELTVELSSGLTLWVIVLGIESVEGTMEDWEQRRGVAITKAKPIVTVALDNGGRQVTLDLTFEDGHRCEGDLLEGVDHEPDAELEDAWTFEGTPGVEMGERTGADHTTGDTGA